MKTLSDQDSRVMLKTLLFTSIISADNDEYTEDVKQEVLRRHKEEDLYGSPISVNIDWEYVFQPLGHDAEKYIKLMKSEVV